MELPGLDAKAHALAPARADGRQGVTQGRRYRRGRDLVAVMLAGWLLRLPALIRYVRGLPTLEVRVSERDSGRMIAAHLGLRWMGIPRFRLAQGVFHIPSDFAAYTRGRSRRSLRNNCRRARKRGVVCEHTMLPSWTPDDRDLGMAAPTEYWCATNAAGEVVGEAWVTADEECALLHGLETAETGVRWLLHATLVEWLCDAGCRVLVTNSCDVPLLPAGQRHFQRLLGYSVARLSCGSLQHVVAGEHVQEGHEGHENGDAPRDPCEQIHAGPRREVDPDEDHGHRVQDAQKQFDDLLHPRLGATQDAGGRNGRARRAGQRASGPGR